MCIRDRNITITLTTRNTRFFISKSIKFNLHPEPVFSFKRLLQRLPLVALSILLWVTESNFKRSMLCVWGEICSNNACDLNCVCSFRMSFLFVGFKQVFHSTDTSQLYKILMGTKFYTN